MPELNDMLISGGIHRFARKQSPTDPILATGRERVLKFVGEDGVEPVDPGEEASFRLMLDHPGRFQFQCSIHPDMKGEILLLTVDAV